MNKSKFKSVRVKHFGGIELVCKSMFDSQNVWQGTLNNWDYFRFSEDTIELYPELFEVEKAEREFEYWACYKAKFASCSDWEIIRYCGDSGFARFGLNQHFRFASFHEIGEKIEL